MAVPARLLRPWLAALTNHNAQGEYYLFRTWSPWPWPRAWPWWGTALPMVQVAGVNSPVQLAALERAHQQRQAHGLMEQGVRLADPACFDLRDHAHARLLHLGAGCRWGW